MVCSNRSTTMDARRERQRKRRSGTLPRPGEKIACISSKSDYSRLTMRCTDVATGLSLSQQTQRVSDIVVDVDDVGRLRAARLHFGVGGDSSARMYSRQRVSSIQTVLCAPGTAAAAIGNAVCEERGQDLCGAGQYSVHISTPSHGIAF